jgi:hypothetical protein
MPKGCFITAEAIEREIGQIGDTQKALGELDSGTGRFRCESEHRFQIIFVVGHEVLLVLTARPCPLDHSVVAMSLASLLRQQERIDQARELLEPIYHWFEEGAATSDIGRARDFLMALH